MGNLVSTTQWSAILAIKDLSNPNAQKALANLCKKYWTPLYIYVRKKGYSLEDAQDLVQGFFADLIDKEYLKKVDKEKGKFRSFLLTAMNHYLINEWDKTRAQKRGGDKKLLSLDFEEAEVNYKNQPSDELSPDKIYERQWAINLLNRVFNNLKKEFDEDGKQNIFENIKNYLTYDDSDYSYMEIAQRVGMTEGAIKVTVHRARKRFGQLLRDEIVNTVSDPSEVEDEIRYLFTVFD